MLYQFLLLLEKFSRQQKYSHNSKSYLTVKEIFSQQAKNSRIWQKYSSTSKKIIQVAKKKFSQL